MERGWEERDGIYGVGQAVRPRSLGIYNLLVCPSLNRISSDTRAAVVTRVLRASTRSLPPSAYTGAPPARQGCNVVRVTARPTFGWKKDTRNNTFIPLHELLAALRPFSKDMRRSSLHALKHETEMIAE